MKYFLFLIIFSFSFLHADTFINSYEEIKKAYDMKAYELSTEILPRVFARKIPEEIKKLEGFERRKFFVRIVLPVVLLENEKITAEHDFVMSHASKKDWNKEDVRIIKEIAQKYNILDESQDITAIPEEKKEKIRYFLDHKIRPVPPAIAVGQAALESGWGTSRFVFEGNNLFGHVSTDPENGIKPKNWTGNKRHIKIFDSIFESIEAYMLNLNRNRAYSKFRWYRRTHPKNLSKIAEGFDKYARIKDEYVSRLQSVMFKFGVHRVNKARLESPEKAESPENNSMKLAID